MLLFHLTFVRRKAKKKSIHLFTYIIIYTTTTRTPKRGWTCGKIVLYLNMYGHCEWFLFYSLWCVHQFYSCCCCCSFSCVCVCFFSPLFVFINLYFVALSFSLSFEMLDENKKVNETELYKSNRKRKQEMNRKRGKSITYTWKKTTTTLTKQNIKNKKTKNEHDGMLKRRRKRGRESFYQKLWWRTIHVMLYVSAIQKRKEIYNVAYKLMPIWKRCALQTGLNVYSIC